MEGRERSSRSDYGFRWITEREREKGYRGMKGRCFVNVFKD